MTFPLLLNRFGEWFLKAVCYSTTTIGNLLHYQRLCLSWTVFFSGSAACPKEGTTNLHLDMSDAVNIMVCSIALREVFFGTLFFPSFYKNNDGVVSYHLHTFIA